MGDGLRLQEIRFTPPGDPRPQGEPCPHCHEATGTDHRLRLGPVPCPQGRPGCCVLHVGWSCPSCGRVYRYVREEAP